MREPGRAGDVAVRRARRRIIWTTGALITLLITVVGGVAYAVMTHAQDDQVRREVRYGAAHGDLSRPPGCMWLYGPGATTLPNAPAGFPLRADLDRVRLTRAPVERTVRRADTAYLVRTQVRDDGDVVQAVFDLRFQLADRSHLWFALSVAEVVGLAAAAVTGTVLGRRAVAPLAEALARQRRFVADASHELRTPITRVHTRAQVLARRAAAEGLPSAHREGLALLVASLGRLGEVLDDLLSSATLTAGQTWRAMRRRVDLVALARSAVADEAERVRERGLTVRVDGPPHPLWVDGVASALRRAVGELLANAIAHTPPGGRIEVALSRSGTTVVLVVTDTGAGFDAGEAERLFRRFHRGGGGRYGLGLALLREVVTSHGGTVVAAGRPGRGARFTLRLPQSAPSPPAVANRAVRAWCGRRVPVPLSGRPRPAAGPGRPGRSRR
ncbi:HAMP domain-containing sensor histidine kinase [Streptomyces glaucus]|uniref:Sensor-like histidine kinase SenX3 n=1 Tax=Streptomyces glaucus TaxID=284029 RepID=A0ABN3JL24_9ACTN